MLSRLINLQNNQALAFLIEHLILAKTKEPKLRKKLNLVHLFEQYKFDINGLDDFCAWNGRCSFTMLHLACIRRNYVVVCDLLSIGADVNIVSSNNLTAIYYALDKNNYGFQVSVPYDIINRLLDEKKLNVHPAQPILTLLKIENNLLDKDILLRVMAHPTFNVNCLYNFHRGCILSYFIATYKFDLAEKLLQQPGIDVDLMIGDHTLSPLITAESLLNSDENQEAATLFAKMLPLSKNANADFYQKIYMMQHQGGNMS